MYYTLILMLVTYPVTFSHERIPSITNLNGWLLPLSEDCHIHLLNYNQIDFEPFKFPVSIQDVISRRVQSSKLDYTTYRYTSSTPSETHIHHGPIFYNCIAAVFIVLEYDSSFHQNGSFELASLFRPTKYFGVPYFL